MGKKKWKHTRCKFLALPQTADVFPLCSCGSVRHCYYTNTYLGPRNLGSGQSQVTYRHWTSSTRDNTKMSQTANLKGKILNVPYPHIWFKIPEVGYKLKLGFFNYIFSYQPICGCRGPARTRTTSTRVRRTRSGPLTTATCTCRASRWVSGSHHQQWKYFSKHFLSLNSGQWSQHVFYMKYSFNNCVCAGYC